MKLSNLKQTISDKIKYKAKDLLNEIQSMTEVSHTQFKEQLNEICTLSRDFIKLLLDSMNHKKQEVLSFYVKSNPYKVKILEKALDSASKIHDIKIPPSLHEKLKRHSRLWGVQDTDNFSRFKLVEPPAVKIPNSRKDTGDSEDTQPRKRRNYTAREAKNSTSTPDNMQITNQDIINDMLRVTYSGEKRKTQFSSPRGRSQATLKLFDKDIKQIKDKIKALKNKEKKALAYSASNPYLTLSSKDFQMKPWTSSVTRDRKKLHTSAGNRSKNRRNSRSQDLGFESRYLSP
jgi:hypothetical protein